LRVIGGEESQKKRKGGGFKGRASRGDGRVAGSENGFGNSSPFKKKSQGQPIWKCKVPGGDEGTKGESLREKK